MKRLTHLRIRKTHRYLGLITGIQFVMWTIGGLYFSWSDIDEIHGDHQRKHATYFSNELQLTSPSQVLAQLPQADEVKSLRLIDVLGEPVYQISYTHHVAANGHGQEHTQLASAVTGALRNPLTEQEAVQMAQNAFSDSVQVAQVDLLTEGSLHGHHEYRGGALPAFAVTMQHPTNTTVYVAAAKGEVTKFRNNKWRIFDFLWMLHTMDYQGRDNFGNILLRVFSIAGMVTILSGFVLYFASRGSGRRKALIKPTAAAQR